MIKLFMTDQPPQGWAVCDGRMLNKSDYPELFSRLGHRFGGEGDEFALPNLEKEVAGFFVIMVENTKQSDADHQGMVSQIVLNANEEPPKGYLPCDGRLVNPSDYPVLNQVMGNRFGGDANGNIALPLLPEKNGVPYIICVEGIHPMPQVEDEDDI